MPKRAHNPFMKLFDNPSATHRRLSPRGRAVAAAITSDLLLSVLRLAEHQGAVRLVSALPRPLDREPHTRITLDVFHPSALLAHEQRRVRRRVRVR